MPALHKQGESARSERKETFSMKGRDEIHYAKVIAEFKEDIA